jgi:hypothetical protein
MLPRQRQKLNEDNTNIYAVNEVEEELAEFTREHKPLRRNLQGFSTLNRRLRRGMLFAILCGAIYLLYSRIQTGEAARFNWNKQTAWKASWYIYARIFSP